MSTKRTIPQLKNDIKCYGKTTGLSHMKKADLCELSSWYSSKSDHMRTVIRPQIDSFKKNNPDNRCTKCRTSKNPQVDHYENKFRDIRNSFLQLYTKKMTQKQLLQFVKQETTQEATRIKFVEQWLDHHFSIADYRWLCGSCNKQEG